MATYSSVLAWREPGGLPSMGSHRVGHNQSDLAAAAANGDESSGSKRPVGQTTQFAERMNTHLVD